MAAIRLSPVFSDAVHGNRGGASLHAEATSSLAGFMSAADKARLDATPTPYITFKQGGVTGGGVVATWAEVDAFASATQSPWTLYNDNSIELCEVPGTAPMLDFRGLMTLKYSGAPSIVPGDIALRVRDGAVLKNIGAFGTNSQLACESFTVSPVIFDIEGSVVIFREGGRVVAMNGALVPTIVASTSQHIFAFLEAGTIVDDSGTNVVPVCDFTNVGGGFFLIFQLVNSGGGAGIGPNVFRADPAALFLNGHDATCSLSDQSLHFAGTVIDNPIARSEWTAWQSGDTGTRPVATSVGQPYFDTDLGFCVWWSGSDWVDATGAVV